jgi:hypothetical protein
MRTRTGGNNIYKDNNRFAAWTWSLIPCLQAYAQSCNVQLNIVEKKNKVNL